MPRKKATNDGAMLSTNTAVVESVDESAAVAVAEPTYGDAATAAMQDIEKDQKLWRTMVFECSKGAPTPPENILQRIASSVGVSYESAKHTFEQDVQAVRKQRQAEKVLETYEQKKADFIAEHADEKTLQQQLQDLLDQEKMLRSLIAKSKHLDFVIGSKKAEARRIGAAFDRLY